MFCDVTALLRRQSGSVVSLMTATRADQGMRSKTLNRPTRPDRLANENAVAAPINRKQLRGRGATLATQSSQLIVCEARGQCLTG
jgi:hypothetical protein